MNSAQQTTSANLNAGQGKTSEGATGKVTPTQPKLLKKKSLKAKKQVNKPVNPNVKTVKKQIPAQQASSNNLTANNNDKTVFQLSKQPTAVSGEGSKAAVDAAKQSPKVAKTTISPKLVKQDSGFNSKVQESSATEVAANKMQNYQEDTPLNDIESAECLANEKVQSGSLPEAKGLVSD